MMRVAHGDAASAAECLETRFLRTHLVLPLAFGALLVALFLGSDLDRQLAWAVAFDPSTNRFPERDTFWASTVMHVGGRYTIWAIALICMFGWLWAWRAGRHMERRAWAFSIGALTLTVGIAAALKHLTNVDCPWDLRDFGGDRPYVGLFADRPDSLPAARCYPGAHATSGFALFAVYFGFRDSRPRLARAAFLAAIAAGVGFSIAQEMRGAHFLSHDISSGFLAWFASLAAYVLVHRSPWPVVSQPRFINPAPASRSPSPSHRTSTS